VADLALVAALCIFAVTLVRPDPLPRLDYRQGIPVDRATLVVVPLTSQRRRGADALRVPIPARDRLLRECWAMAEQPRALDRNRIGEGPLTRLSAAEMNALEQALRAALGLAGG
jgi:mRNA-degrading endonuclease toxin of MazEF toxin-antitoxin module